MSGKWKVLILWHLSFVPCRFARLRKLLPGISEKVLSAQLRDLERDGVISRARTGTVPPEVTYSLTTAGAELVPVMEAMCAWGTRNLGIVPTLPRRPNASVPVASSSSSET
jgi:DNA-binding HxlR family transcriptional regulator